MPTLSQRLGSFPSESRAELFLHCRQDFPLPSLINRGGFDGMREENIGSKISQKTSDFPCFCNFSLFPLPFSPPWPSATTTLITGLPTISSTTGSQHNHQPTTKSHRRFLSPLCSPSRFLLLLLPLPPTSTATTGFTTIISINPAPHQWQSSDRDLLSLLLPAFLSPLQLFSSSSHSQLRPPSPQTTPPKPPAEPPHHVRDPHTRQLPSPCFASCFLGVAAFLHAAAN